MKTAGIILALVVVCAIVIVGQAPPDAKLQAQLKSLFPGAAAFSPKEGNPAHYKAFASDGKGGRTLSGYAFWTTELVPLERAYDGPIKILVGMDTKGVLSGIIVVEHNEPYGNFSIDMPAFPAQFKGKSIRTPFKVGEDIDAVSRATISITSASRAVRNSARRVARELLKPEDAQ